MFKTTVDSILKDVTAAIGKLDKLARDRYNDVTAIDEKVADLEAERKDAEEERARAVRIADKLNELIS